MKELGIKYSKENTTFKVLAPTVEDIKLLIYEGPEEISRDEYIMTRNEDGIYSTNVEGDLKDKFYTYLVNNKNEVTDPYSYAGSLNGIRGCIVDLNETKCECDTTETDPRWDILKKLNLKEEV